MVSLALLFACARSPEVRAPEERPPRPAAAPAAGMSALVDKAKARAPEAVRFAAAKGVAPVPIESGRSFALSWSPRPGAPVLVSLHGHEGLAHEELKVWAPHAEARGFALFAPQWWVGAGDDTGDYLNPRELYRSIDQALTASGATRGRVALHGFSRGSAVTYAVAAMDGANAKWFGFVVANAGGAAMDFPPTAEVDRGVHGVRPYAGQRWVLFCGGKDPDPEINGCPAMRRTKAWVTGKGAKVEALIEDPEGDHGAFMRRERNVEKALGMW
ncbi:MAG: hypothetical protein ACOZNI_12730 [Myxococcota bacterium]